MTPRRCYIAGWRACRKRPGVPVIDPNRLPPELLDAWSNGFHDALVAPPEALCEPEEAGYDD
jgi:hypothetical protein